MKRDSYDKQLIRWVKNHYWDSLEKDKDLILRHLRTFAKKEEPCPVCELLMRPDHNFNFCMRCGRELT